jgi:hypothetical protein
MSSKEIEAAKLALEEGKIITTSETLARLKDNLGIKDARATALFGAYINKMNAERQIEAGSYEAERSRTHAASQTDKQIAASANEAAASRSAAAGSAAASRALQEKLANMPDANQRFYASLSPTGNVREGYAYAMEQRGESSTNRDILVRAEKFLENRLNQRANPELWKQAQEVVGRSFAIQPPSVTSKPAGPIFPQK